MAGQRRPVHFPTAAKQRFVFRWLGAAPAVCGSEPSVKGTRVTVRTVLASLAEGMGVEEIVRDFPTLDAASVRAVPARGKR